jgi:hypothetical protein
MTEEMEKKLNELLGLKKELEELKEQKQNEVASTVIKEYEKGCKTARVRWWIGFGTGLLMYILFIVLAGSIYNNVVLRTVFIGIGILMLGTPIIAKVAFLIRQSKLEILKEMKLFELRITELLKNKSP